MRFFSVFFLIFISMSCAPKDSTTPATNKLRQLVFATKVNATTATCYVEFQLADSLNTTYYLEDEAIVACDGVQAPPSGSGYATSFVHPGADPVKITVVRPKAGATVISYSDLQ